MAKSKLYIYRVDGGPNKYYYSKNKNQLEEYLKNTMFYFSHSKITITKIGEDTGPNSENKDVRPLSDIEVSALDNHILQRTVMLEAFKNNLKI